MNILHLISQYNYTKVYKRLINNLDLKKEIKKQYIYIPLREESNINKNNKNTSTIKYFYSKIYNKLDRILYYPRISKTYKDVVEKINLSKIDYIHAHTLFADGAVALKLYKKYGIKYSITVRSTDTSAYLKYMKHSKIILYDILKNADKIILVSPRMKDNIKNNLNKRYRDEIIKKCIVIPNGIDDYWFENLYYKKRILKKDNKINFIQVGYLNSNKNCSLSIKFIEYLRKLNLDCTLKVIGDGPDKLNCEKLVKSLKLDNKVKFLGRIDDLNKLRDEYRKSDIFILPSKRETFGLVYIEAISQGLPVIYTSNTGIDGYFKKIKVGCSIYQNNFNKSILSIQSMLEEYNNIVSNITDVSKQFMWKDITQILVDKIYRRENEE